MRKFLLKGRLLLVIVASMFTIGANAAQDYYVSASGSDSNNGFSSTSPFQTIQKAADLVSAGGTVYIMNGTYNSTAVNGNLIKITRSGTADNYITFKPMPGHSPKLKASGGNWECILVEASYIIFDGFELEGNNANITYEAAYKSWQDYDNNIRDWNLIPNFNTNCITIGKNVEVHHIIIRNCKVHDFPAAGIGGGKMDYVTIENNIVYNNCWYTMYATSGISVMGEYNSDSSTGYKIIVRNNILYNNKTTVPWYRTKALSDGNGIIMDINNHKNAMGEAYNGRTLVENNVSYNNGGGGIHCVEANHVDIINNTTYNNGTVVGYPEIDAQNSTDVKVYNNIMYARTGARCNGNDAGTYNYNIYYNGTSYNRGVNDNVTDPKFVSKGLDGNANFRLQASSPAINSGNTASGQYSIRDILGVTRTSPDRGAYEYNLVTNPTFDTNTIGWTIEVNAPAAATINTLAKTGFAGQCCKVNITNVDAVAHHIQLRQPIAITSGKTYTVTFKACGGWARTIGIAFQQNTGSYSTWWSQSINLTTTPTTYGPYTFNCTTTDATNLFKFMLGNNINPVYIDDVVITETTSTLKSGLVETVLGNTTNTEVGQSVSVYPNPMTDLLKVNVPATIGERISIQMFDMQGRNILSKNFEASCEGNNTIELETRLIVSGTYVLKVLTNSGLQKSVMVVK